MNSRQQFEIEADGFKPMTPTPPAGAEPSPEAKAVADTVFPYVPQRASRNKLAKTIDATFAPLRAELAALKKGRDWFEEQYDKAVQILDGNAAAIDWTDRANSELLRKLCEHLNIYQARAVLKVRKERDGLRAELAAAKEAHQQATARIGELELQLTVVGEMAVRDWDDKVVGLVDSSVKSGEKYKDQLRVLFIENPERIKCLRSDLTAARARIGELENQVIGLRAMYDGAHLSRLDLLKESNQFRTQLALANAKAEEARTELEGKSKDSERLDWLEANNAGLNNPRNWLHAGPHVWLENGEGKTIHFDGETYRAAIDAARSALSGKGEA